MKITSTQLIEEPLPPMNEDIKKKSHRSGLIAWLIVLLPVIYVLSIGPFAWWDRPRTQGTRELDPDGLWVRFYAPVCWLHDQTPLRKPLDAYYKLWGL